MNMTDEEFVLMSFELKMETKQNNWILNSGASNHMTWVQRDADSTPKGNSGKWREDRGCAKRNVGRICEECKRKTIESDIGKGRLRPQPCM